MRQDDNERERRTGAPARRTILPRGATFFKRLAMRELPPMVLGEERGRELERFEAKQWSLVLTARAIPHHLKRQGPGWTVLAPRRRADEAAAEIAAFLGENRNVPQAEPETATGTRANPPGTLWALGLGAAILAWFGSDAYLFGQRVRWEKIGSGDTGAMLDGQWWRALTALTLHADPAHLVGNLVAGGVFLLLLCREVGPGLAMFLCLAAGTAGNLLKAAFQGPGQHFLGASTAVFGALGVLGGLAVARRFTGWSWRRAAPAGAALMLLAMIGAGEEGERIDLAGHFLGFASGLAMGGLTGAVLRERARPDTLLDLVFGGASLTALVYAWSQALRLAFG